MKSCSSIALDIQTYYAGKNQVTHPNVIEFKEAWHGYHFYMGYTPYPFANGSEENPCIAASNDLVHWETPRELINPIACCEEVQCDELKDTHLLYRSDLDRLELWYLGRLNSTFQSHGPLYCFRKVSSDSIHWSNFQIMYRFDSLNIASESVIYHNNKYCFWGIRNDRTEIGLYYMESKDGTTWSKLSKCFVPRATETSMWHGCVSFYENIYYFVWVGNKKLNRNKIFLSTSPNGHDFTDPEIVITNTVGWDFLYRPALLLSKNKFYCYYGVVRKDNRWLIALSSGDTPKSFIGIRLNAAKKANPQLTPGGITLSIKTILHQIDDSVVPRLFLLIPFLLLLISFSSSFLLSWIIAILLCCYFHFLRFNRQHYLKYGFFSGTIIAASSTFLYQLFSEILSFLLS